MGIIPTRSSGHGLRSCTLWHIAGPATRIGVVLGVTICGCRGSPDGNGPECRDNTDCPPGEVCIDSHCVRVCFQARDCEVGEFCSDDYCQIDPSLSCGANGQCDLPGPCEEPGFCFAGKCFYERKSAGSECEDGDLCTINDACNDDGVCVGEPRICDTPPSNECSSNDDTYIAYPSHGRCVSSSGECVFEPTEIPCSNCAQSCLPDCVDVVCDDVVDPCKNRGICVPGSSPQCKYEPSANGTRCDRSGSDTETLDGVCMDSRCVECIQASDCQSPPSGDAACHQASCVNNTCRYEKSDGGRCAGGLIDEWGACKPSSATCSEQGIHYRNLVFYRCLTGICSPDVLLESEECTHDPEGAQCAPDEPGSWSECSFTDFCAEIGTQDRGVTVHTCKGNVCSSSASSETQECTRSTDDLVCANVSYSEWGQCTATGDICDESGSQKREVTTYRCMDGACNGTLEVETRPCTRDTDGLTCEARTYGSWSACSGFSNTCDTTGTQSRTATDWTCDNQTCGSSSSTESRSCTRTVANGTKCGSSSYQVCCSGTCRDTRANNQYCGSCTANCQDQGLTCRTISGAGYACGSCASNAACKDVLDGSGNSDVTCYDVNNPPAYCQCQCPSCGPNCVCKDGGCGANAYCYECSGTNVCKPYSGSCP